MKWTLGIDMAHRINILTNSNCNLGCEHCTQTAWRDEIPYTMTLEEIDEFIEYTKSAGYVYGDITISGGESLLWSDLPEAMRRLKESGIVRQISLFTNGMYLRTLREAEPWLDRIRISVYGLNKKHAEEAAFEFPNKVKIEDKSKFIRMPTGPIPNSVPGSCNCSGFCLFDRKIYFCPNVLDIMIKFNLPQESPFMIPLGPNYLDAIQQEKGVTEHCSYCAANPKVVRVMGRVQNDPLFHLKK